MRLPRKRVPASIEDGGTGARTAQEALAELGAPTLEGDNYFTGENYFGRVHSDTLGTDGDLTLTTVDTVTVERSGGSAVLDFSLLGSNRTLTFQDASGTVAFISDITAGSGTASGQDVVVDFGSSFTQYASTVVTGCSWVASGTKIVATLKADSGKAVEGAVLSFSCVVSDLVVGTGFTLSVFAPFKAKGTYTFSCVGV